MSSPPASEGFRPSSRSPASARPTPRVGSMPPAPSSKRRPGLRRTPRSRRSPRRRSPDSSAPAAKWEARPGEERDAGVGARAAEGAARRERARREELVTQLEDARSRLTAAYEEHGKLQDTLANGRVELERTRLQADRTIEAL